MASGLLASRVIKGYSLWRVGLLASRAMNVYLRGELLSSPRRAMNKQATGSANFSPKVPNLTMFNLKTIRNISSMIILGSVFSSYISFTISHHLIINSSQITYFSNSLKSTLHLLIIIRWITV